MFTKESLERLRERVDLLETLEPYVDFKRVGSSYKALCPFHQEKTPSFVLQKGDTHFHCFGCGVHGDAIQFLINYLNISFVEAVEILGERFHVPLEWEDKVESKGINKAHLKECLDQSARFFHEYLLYSEGGKDALHYLFQRGITLDFINRFEIGYAPDSNVLVDVIKDVEVLRQAGLVNTSNRPFFRERITFPVRDHLGRVSGFSARKIREETFGGKYINTQETALFKKSRILFGLNYSRSRITKQRRVILVEGQIDCLKLIEAGLNLTVATLGTAFGERHAALLKQLGVHQAYLLFDGDRAGAAASSKAGDLFQKIGIEVFVPRLPDGSDPDLFLTKHGIEPLVTLLDQAQSYLAFQVGFLGEEIDLSSPAGKAELVKNMKKQMERWEDPVMVHESLRKLASMVKIPEEMVRLNKTFASNLFIKKHGSNPSQQIDPDRVLELDLLRWLIVTDGSFYKTAIHYLTEAHFWIPSCRTLFEKVSVAKKPDLLTLAADLEEPEIIDEILKKRVNLERAETHFLQTVQKILDRQWMHTREQIKLDMESGEHAEEEVLKLTKQFVAFKREIAEIQ